MQTSSQPRAGPTGVAPPPPAISIVAVSKRFGRSQALDAATLELRTGEILGLLGPNGAGKTTLVRCIMGRARPDAGSITVAGFPAGSARACAAMGWVPQDLALYPQLTARENLDVFGAYQGLSGRALSATIANSLEWAALKERADEPVRTFSGGMKRRLNMAAALLHCPRVLLLDEPTVGVDPQSRERIYSMIASLRARGASILLTIHYMEEAERLCDRVAIFDRGRIVAMGTRDELVLAAFGQARDLTFELTAAPSAEAATWFESAGARREGLRVHVAVTDPLSEMAELLHGMRARDLGMRDLRLSAPGLESVFFHLTGRELRE